MSRRTHNGIPLARLGFAAITCLLILSGCYHRPDFENLPPEVDISTPPKELEEPERIQPRHPPAFWTFAAFIRPQWEIGGIGDEVERQRSRRWGAEGAVGVGPGIGPWAIPVHLPGLGVGCAPCRSDHPEGRRYYSELHASALILRLSAGWTFQPSAGRHGPQITVGLPDFFHLRWYKLSDHRYSLVFGMSFPVAGFFYSRAR